VATQLFAGKLSPRDARAVLRRTGAAFVLADCSATADLSKPLAPILLAVHHFGCATVYTLDAPGKPTGPLAQSRGHAALRPSRRQ
jgi:hypothetical protein